MNKELFIETSDREVVIALAEDKSLVELYRIKSENKFSVGDVFLGKIKKIMPGLNAAFVDIGDEKDAFLHYLDLGPKIKLFNKYVEQSLTGKQPKMQILSDESVEKLPKDGNISQILKSGDHVIVQITKENISTKGARVTSDVSFPGRFIVLIPFASKIYVSQKIRSAEERNRLKHLIQSIKPKNFGVIIRTVAEGKTASELNADLTQLVDKWNNIHPIIAKAKKPVKVVDEMDKSVTILRDFLNADFANIFVNDEPTFNEIKDYIANVAPEKKKIVHRYTGQEPMFEHYNLQKQIRSAFGKIVPFSKKGAYLVMEHTEALHVIDVNSGRRTNAENTQEDNAFQVNMDAAVAVARQLRLRDIGGIIVVDFIDMHNPQHRKALYEKLVSEMSNDKAKHTVLPPTAFGLVQITRQRARTETAIEVLNKCPMCNGYGQVASHEVLFFDIESSLDKLLATSNYKKIIIELNPYVYKLLRKGKFFTSQQWQWRRKYGSKIKTKKSRLLPYLGYNFLDDQENEIKL